MFIRDNDDEFLESASQTNHEMKMDIKKREEKRKKKKKKSLPLRIKSRSEQNH